MKQNLIEDADAQISHKHASHIHHPYHRLHYSANKRSLMPTTA